jgi:hypothetical protein
MMVQIDPSRMACRRRRRLFLAPRARPPGRRAFRVQEGVVTIGRKIARINAAYAFHIRADKKSKVPPPKFLEALYW